jgi:3-dehydroquinate synthase
MPSKEPERAEDALRESEGSIMDIRVDLKERGYDIHIGSGDHKGLGQFARHPCAGSLALLVTDEHVGPRHEPAVARSLKEAGFIVKSVTLPAGEAVKSLSSASRLYDILADLRADRKTLVVPLGGGVIGDLAGYVAATFNRGLPILMIPTTLLAMVDSSVGGKVGVNHPKAKNLIGAFHQPIGVWIDTNLLTTLPDREYQSGLAEVVKYGMILDADFFAYLETHAEVILAREPEAVWRIVARCCRLKADIVEKDEREESGLRAVLNYGHTFAHAFETVGGYGFWLHGEAVASGMVCAARLAVRRGLISTEVGKRQDELLARLHLPTRPEPWPIDDLLSAMRSDKKAIAGRLRFVLPKRMGDVAVFEDVTEGEVRQTLEEMRAR